MGKSGKGKKSGCGKVKKGRQEAIGPRVRGSRHNDDVKVYCMYILNHRTERATLYA